MEYTAKLTEKEVEYLFNQVGGNPIKQYFTRNSKNFSEIKPGFRPVSISGEEAVALATKYWKKPFLTTFLNKTIEEWMRQIEEAWNNKDLTVMNRDLSLAYTLPESVFSEMPELFFKLKDLEMTEDSISFIKVCCEVAATIRKESKNDDDEGSSSAEEENATLRKEIDALSDEIAKVQSVAKEKDKKIEALDQELSEKTKQNNSIAHELDEIKKQIVKYAPKPIPPKSEDTPYTSLCEVHYDYDGNMKLNRLVDISGEIMLDELDKSYPDRSQLFSKDTNEEAGTIAVWNWGKIPNIKNPEKDFILSKKDEYLVPIEVIVINDCNSAEDVCKELIEGIARKSHFQKQFWCYRNSSRGYEGILCNKTDYSGDKDVFVLDEDVFELPVYEVKAYEVYDVSTSRVLRRFDLGIPKRIVYTKNPLDIVRELFLKRISWGNMKQAGFSRAEYQALKGTVENIATEDMTKELAGICHIQDADAKEVIDKFVKNAEDYIDGSDLDSEMLEAILKDHPNLMESCMEMAAEKWKRENEEEVREALEKTNELKKKISDGNDRLQKLNESYEKIKKQLEEDTKAVSEKEQIADEVERIINERIEKARNNAADFIAEMAFTQPVSQNLVRPVNANLSSYCEGEEYTGIEPEIMEIIEDLLDTLQAGLYEMGVAKKYSIGLAAFLYSAYRNNTPLLITGPNANEIATAFSVALFGKTPGKARFDGDYSEALIDEILNANDDVVIIENATDPRWNRFYGKMISCKKKLFIATEPMLEDLFLEPKGMLDYFHPLYTGLFVDSLANDQYIRGDAVKKLFEKSKDVNVEDNKLIKKLPMSQLSRKRISKLLTEMHEILDDDSSDYDMLFAVFPMLCVVKKRDDILSYVKKCATDNGVSSDVVALVERNLGIADE